MNIISYFEHGKILYDPVMWYDSLPSLSTVFLQFPAFIPMGGVCVLIVTITIQFFVEHLFVVPERSVLGVLV